jgi:hypothetical protein
MFKTREKHLVAISEESGDKLRVNAGLPILHDVGTLVISAILRHASLEVVVLRQKSFFGLVGGISVLGYGNSVQVA